MAKLLNKAVSSASFINMLLVVSICVWLLAAVLVTGNIWWDPASVNQLPGFLRFVIKAFTGTLALISVPGAWALWLAMLGYWRDFDHSPRTKKTIWFLVIFFGFCYGASIYFWTKIGKLKAGSRVALC